MRFVGAPPHALFIHERLPMNHDQFTLPFLDTTTLGGGFGLYGGFPTAKSRAHTHINSEPEAAEVLDAPVPIEPSVPAKGSGANRLSAA
jgi:hypothetical protein